MGLGRGQTAGIAGPACAGVMALAAQAVLDSARAGRHAAPPGSFAMEMLDVLRAVVEKGASDLHLTIGVPPMIRFHGEVVPLMDSRPLNGQDTERMIFSILTDRQKKEFEEHMDLDCSFALPGLSRFRMNVYRRDGGMGCVMRVISAEIPTMQALGLPKTIQDFIHLTNGMILITGPTGSGKSTTLAAILNEINRTKRHHIMTVEDPIEFVYQHGKSIVNQREVNRHTTSFREALRRVLRQDPDVVLIGEMRDLETTETALTVAETGHLVFGTLHTMGAAQTVDRIVDSFPAYQQAQIRMQLAAGLKGVVSQQLLPKADGSGRIAVREVMKITAGIAGQIREGKTHQIYGAIQTGKNVGMITMEEDVARWYAKKAITYETAIGAVNDSATFHALLERNGIPIPDTAKAARPQPDEKRKRVTR